MIDCLIAISLPLSTLYLYFVTLYTLPLYVFVCMYNDYSTNSYSLHNDDDDDDDDDNNNNNNNNNDDA